MRPPTDVFPRSLVQFRTSKMHKVLPLLSPELYHHQTQTKQMETEQNRSTYHCRRLSLACCLLRTSPPPAHSSRAKCAAKLGDTLVGNSGYDISGSFHSRCCIRGGKKGSNNSSTKKAEPKQKNLERVCVAWLMREGLLITGRVSVCGKCAGVRISLHRTKPELMM